MSSSHKPAKKDILLQMKLILTNYKGKLIYLELMSLIDAKFIKKDLMKSLVQLAEDKVPMVQENFHEILRRNSKLASLKLLKRYGKVSKKEIEKAVETKKKI